ncbi:TetR/AcrR family transcriptional regulator [Mycobacteroides immunogenum]|uniref:TetR family transcriptional regulator n=1 Tax=Mycobacteroides immunogenum TaxID=83262 RepID=A0A7V8LM43_9MYCO|nr:TetR/AcrR family transcriptional regulator [Mycobacteroides immunogenum]AMT71190.1 TetR family transcriptional regulator [Mycobacteroides immunogenum]ANO04297.1 TetR family transcriptional regulator [Mycobacteroides immunogenum]KIU38455.1 TetR family transcriptional regulator [Mycobacteroides immunogenum]KPG05080.1 TetR family transcriptional regulator [Mycobacteroides immunogenum]KPG06666.1 TetR family transcriptional regulator [Mycobacteroides immunogenum]
MTPASGSGRAPQNENGIATHQRIMDAALDVLSTSGWRNASVAEVAARAGVTRGAIQHHFKDRDGLFTAAISYILNMRVHQIEALVQTRHPNLEQTRAIIREIIELHQGPTFKAALQLCIAASDDPILQPRVAAMELEVGARGFWALISVLELDGNNATVRTTVQAFLDCARGLGLAGMLNDDSRRRQHLADHWAETLSQLRSPSTAQ